MNEYLCTPDNHGTQFTVVGTAFVYGTGSDLQDHSSSNIARTTSADFYPVVIYNWRAGCPGSCLLFAIGIYRIEG